MEPRSFTPEEADLLLPRVRQILAFLKSQRDEVVRLEQKKAVEELVWLKEDGSVSPKARQQVERLEVLQRKHAQSFEGGIQQLDTLGVQLKDLDEGLVDFFAHRGGKLVYLCWKDGEDRIRFWHDLETGFAGRRTLEDL